MNINEQVGNPRVRGYCPSCKSQSLFLGNDGYVTCSRIGRNGCQDPAAAHDLLMDEEIHFVVNSVDLFARKRSVSSVEKALNEHPEKGGLVQELERVKRERDVLKSIVVDVHAAVGTDGCGRH